MSYRSETTALRAERDALRAELRQQRQRNDALERALRGEPEPEPEPPEPPPEQRSASSQGASGPLKAGLAVILALPILCGGAAAVLLVIQPSAAEVGARAARAAGDRALRESARLAAAARAAAAATQRAEPRDALWVWQKTLPASALPNVLDRAVQVTRQSNARDKDLGIVAAYVAVAAHQQRDFTREAAAISAGGRHAGVVGEAAIGCALMVTGRPALGRRALRDALARVRGRAAAARLSLLGEITRHCALLGADVRTLLASTMALAHHARERHIDALLETLQAVNAPLALRRLAAEGSVIYRQRALSRFLSLAVAMGDRVSFVVVRDAIKRRIARGGAGLRADELAVGAYVAALAGERARAERLIKRALVTAGERPHRAARLDRPTRSGIARAQVLLGRVAEAQRVDPVASAEERTRVALKQRALAHLADFDKVSCLSETTARVALALLRGGERHAARKRVETCLANDPEQGPALVRLYRLGR